MLASLVVAGAVLELLLRWLYPLGDPYPNQRRIELGAYVPNRHEPEFHMTAKAEPGLSGVDGVHRFQTNAQGFVGADLERASEDARRIFLVGGSTMECMVLGVEGNPATLMQDALTQTSTASPFIVENAGHSGDATFDHVAILSQRIVHLKPDFVFFLVGVNDLIAGLRGEDYAHLHPDQTVDLTMGSLLRLAATRLQLGRLVVAAVGVGRLRRWDPDDPVIETHYQSAARSCAALPPKPLPPLSTDAYAQNLRTLVRVTQAAGARAVLMTQPHSWRTEGKLEAWHWMLCHGGKRYSAEAMADALDRYNEVTRKVAGATGATLVDLARTMPGDEHHLYDDVHFNVGGARALANAMVEVVTRAR
ncbi:MAG: SGNH/GDSL hydrolase family protein [Alphaproteobacteria bacterium]|nr:SGNH/GDSL hydrolase family protein [Alphaproteobacteria bacterium]MCB9746770.1 SGNH/GDSL hydrolase family protein [Alphaproteobacteria bacterium]